MVATTISGKSITYIDKKKHKKIKHEVYFLESRSIGFLLTYVITYL